MIYQRLQCDSYHTEFASLIQQTGKGECYNSTCSQGIVGVDNCFNIQNVFRCSSRVKTGPKKPKEQGTWMNGSQNEIKTFQSQGVFQCERSNRTELAARNEEDDQ